MPHPVTDWLPYSLLASAAFAFSRMTEGRPPFRRQHDGSSSVLHAERPHCRLVTFLTDRLHRDFALR